MLVRDFDFDLPPELIAQTPAEPRDAARLLRLQRTNSATSHHVFRDLPALLRADDLLVFNDTRVLRARLRGYKIGTDGLPGARVEALLLRERERNVWETLLKPSARLRSGTPLVFVSPDGAQKVEATPLERQKDSWIVRFSPPQNRDVREMLGQLGEVPLPPYIQSRASSEADYQTVYARDATQWRGEQSSTRCAENSTLESSAAPTAGLHFTPQLMENLRARGIESCFVTLGIGIGTFRPMQSENVENHVMHREEFEVSDEAARKINAQKARGGRVVAVGTTSVRVLESAAEQNESQVATVRAGSASTEIFIRPGHGFRVVDALVTNFHLPKSTLLVMISAFAQSGTESGDGLAKVRAAYEEAVRERYRFFSFGDAMLID